MTPDQKLQLQGFIVQHLQASAEDHPTMLVDVLLSGDGYNFLNRLLQTAEFAARQQAQALNNLLQAVRGIAPPNTYQPPPPAWQPPQQQQAPQQAPIFGQE